MNDPEKPIRTLSDVVASPPKGWFVKHYGNGQVAFKWYGSCPATVRRDQSGLGWEEWVSAHMPIGKRADAYRAVAELLTMLAEVSDV